MLLTPCEICSKLINDVEVEQSLNFTESIIGISKVLCSTCRHDSNVIKNVIESEVLYG
jgi:hypothetical protein